MNFELNETLQNYMKSKGHKNILITPLLCHT